MGPGDGSIDKSTRELSAGELGRLLNHVRSEIHQAVQPALKARGDVSQDRVTHRAPRLLERLVFHRSRLRCRLSALPELSTGAQWRRARETAPSPVDRAAALGSPGLTPYRCAMGTDDRWLTLDEAVEERARFLTKSHPASTAAAKAWANGHRHFHATIRVGDSYDREIGVLLDHIEDIGWRLHTWQVAAVKRGHAIACPLFVRPE